jgi:Flp pilus assembly protein TadD
MLLLGRADYEMGNYLSALKVFNKLMETEAPRADYYKARGMTYYKTRIFESAAYDLSMSLDLSPNDPETNLYLGLAEKSRGNNEMACYFLQRAKNFGSIEADNYIKTYCK